MVILRSFTPSCILRSFDTNGALGVVGRMVGLREREPEAEQAEN